MQSINQFVEDHLFLPKTKAVSIYQLPICDNIVEGGLLYDEGPAKPWMRAHQHTAEVLIAYYTAKAEDNEEALKKLRLPLHNLKITRIYWMFFQGLFVAGGVDAIRKFFKIN